MRFAEYQSMIKKEERELDYLTPNGGDIDKTLVKRFNSYKHRKIKISGAPLSCIIAVDTIDIGGYPYPYLICKPSNGAGSITINLLEKIAYKRYDSQEMIVIIKGKHTGKYNIDCILRCYN